MAMQHDVLGGLAHPLLLVRIGWQEISRSQLPRTSRRPVADVLDLEIGNLPERFRTGSVHGTQLPRGGGIRSERGRQSDLGVHDHAAVRADEHRVQVELGHLG